MVMVMETTIKLSKEFKELLRSQRQGKETFEQIIKRLMGDKNED